MGTSLDKFRQGREQGAIVRDAVTEARALVPLAMPALPTKHALTAFWERAIAALPGVEKQRRRVSGFQLPCVLNSEHASASSPLPPPLRSFWGTLSRSSTSRR